MHENIDRVPAVAGTFYPSEPKVLRDDIDSYLDSAAGIDKVPGAVIGLISPHAGYMYSGRVAAAAYCQLSRADYDYVLVISPSHHTYFQGASLYSSGDYQTPLGVIPLAGDIVQKLLSEYSVFHYVDQAHRQEHALEVQLPFLQVVLSKFALIPVVMGSQDWETASMMVEALGTVLFGKRVLLVASSDLSHYHSYDEAVSLDSNILEAVNNNDSRALWNVVAGGKAEACGAGPMVAVMMLAAKLGATGARVVAYQNSGDVTGDRGQVVGYMAAAIYK
ncbi:MAG: AmmeMemoRadiSam system protein B [Pseudomonadota bacterium]|nr:AmmeMemoRadiSam system protein B [Pseudomonadota bacterium]